MTTRKPRTGFASRPGAADAWIAGPEGAEAPTAPSPPVNSARLTIDVTPQLRQRLKLAALQRGATVRSEEHTSELQSLMRITYAVFWLKKKILSGIRPTISNKQTLDITILRPQ